MKLFLYFNLGLSIICFSCSIPEKTRHICNLNSRQLNSIPDTVWKDKNITDLLFGAQWASINPLGGYYAPDQNQLTELPDNICTLKKLRRLDVSFNKIQFLPECLSELQSLEYLNLSFNQSLNIGQAVKVAKQLKRLKFLDLSGIPQAMEDSSNIRDIFKNGNMTIIITKTDMLKHMDN
jgi:hypothetical protein